MKCSNHKAEAVKGKTVCRLCLLRMKLAYERRRLSQVIRRCLRCGIISKWGRKCKSKFMCYACKRTLRKNPDAELRKWKGD